MYQRLEREHAASLRKLKTAGHLAAHCDECQCEATLFDLAIVGLHQNQLGRELLEDLATDEKGEDWLSGLFAQEHTSPRPYIFGNSVWEHCEAPSNQQLGKISINKGKVEE